MYVNRAFRPQSSLDETKLTKMRGVLGAMTSSDVEELSADLVNTALLTLQKEFSQMDPPAKRRLVKKVQPHSHT